jgi:hypothetical protein
MEIALYRGYSSSICKQKNFMPFRGLKSYNELLKSDNPIIQNNQGKR